MAAQKLRRRAATAQSSMALSSTAETSRSARLEVEDARLFFDERIAGRLVRYRPSLGATRSDASAVM